MKRIHLSSSEELHMPIMSSFAVHCFAYSPGLCFITDNPFGVTWSRHRSGLTYQARGKNRSGTRPCAVNNLQPLLQNLAAKFDLSTVGCCNARAKHSYVASDVCISRQRLSTPTQNILDSHNCLKLSLILERQRKLINYFD